MVVEGVLAVALIVSNHMDLIITVVVGHTAVCAIAVSNRRLPLKVGVAKALLSSLWI